MSRAQLTSTVEQNTGGAVSPYVAGKNFVINGGMDFWQRGTSIAVGLAYAADRWVAYRGGANTGCTITRQSSGLTGIQYTSRIQRDSGNSTTFDLNYRCSLETVNSIPLAGQVVTLSAYVRKGANYSSSGNGLNFLLVSGTGTDESIVNGFTGQSTVASVAAVLTSSWQRISVTGTVSSSATQLGIVSYFTPSGTAGAADYYEITGVQLEIGSVATPFSRAGGTLSGELAACQRYYFAQTSNTIMQGTSSTRIVSNAIYPTPMRTTPTVTLTSTTPYWESVPYVTVGSITSAGIEPSKLTASGGTLSIVGTFGTTPVQNYPGAFGANQLTFSAEL